MITHYKQFNSLHILVLISISHPSFVMARTKVVLTYEYRYYNNRYVYSMLSSLSLSGRILAGSTYIYADPLGQSAHTQSTLRHTSLYREAIIIGTAFSE